MTVRVQVTHAGVIQHLHDTFGGRIGTVRTDNVSPRTTKRSRNIHTWIAGATVLREILPELNKYLVIKKRHGEIFLEAFGMRVRSKKGTEHAQYALYEELRRLNDRTLPE